mmetsp:Transcript_5771/g.10331  ORF Transcript_5771/g.10331 Transcript_5771/m.10331 type:complete len:331 (+) Transcript_5771:107-1099(+)
MAPGVAAEVQSRLTGRCRPLLAEPLLRVVIAATVLVLRSDAAGLRAIRQSRNRTASGRLFAKTFADAGSGGISFLSQRTGSSQQYHEMMATAAPPPGPYPEVLWVQQFPPAPLLTTPPLPEQCFGCHCLFVHPNAFLDGGNIADKYTCVGGAATHRIPGISWVGQPGQDKIGQNGQACPECACYALTVEDLDYPDGVGETSNGVRTIFWAVNIPSDWTELTEENAFKLDEAGRPIVVVGKNVAGGIGLEQPCPGKGTHRYRTTLWALDRHLGDDMSPLRDSMTAEEIHGMIQDRELARASFFGNVKSPGYDSLPSSMKLIQGFARSVFPG